MTHSPEAILRDRAWLPHTFDPAGNLLDFVRLELDDRRRLAFLAEEYVGSDFAHQVLHYADVKALTPSEDEAPVHFIFHTSFCCSSLLARVLESGGAAEALREPDILMNLANRILREPVRANLDRLEIALRLLSRPIAAKQVIIKPSNFANNLIGPILKLRPEARALLFHSDLQAFLRSTAKKGMWGRIWARKLFARHSQWSGLRLELSQAELFEMSDLQVAGLAWLAQAWHFRQLAQHHGRQRLVLIHADKFLSDRERVITQLSRHFGLGYDAAAVAAIVASGVFERNSKSTDEEFDASRREAEHRQVMDAHGEEIAMVAEWTTAVAARIGVDSALDDLDIDPARWFAIGSEGA